MSMLALAQLLACLSFLVGVIALSALLHLLCDALAAWLGHPFPAKPHPFSRGPRCSFAQSEPMAAIRGRSPARPLSRPASPLPRRAPGTFSLQAHRTL